MRRKGLGPLVFILLLTVGSLGYTFAAGNEPFLGLDLQGGISVVLQPDGEATDEQLDDAVAIIRQRIDAVGVAEPEITRQGSTIVVEIAGVSNRDEAIDLVGQTGELRFRPVLEVLPPEISLDGELPLGEDGTPTTDATAPEGTTDTTAADPAEVTTSTTAAPAGGADEQGLGLAPGESAGAAQETSPPTSSDIPATTVAPEGTTDTTVLDPSTLDPSTLDPSTLDPSQIAGLGAPVQTTPPEEDLPEVEVVLPQYDDVDGEQVEVARYRLGPALLTGDALEGATASIGQTGQWVVNPRFKGGSDGIDLFNAAAAECFARTPVCPTGQLGITLDGEVVSAPTIQEASFQRDQIQISGSFDESSAKNLATVLRYGALPVQLEQQSVQLVSASLGRDALDAGLVAGAVGIALVTLYMIAFYRLLGVAAIAKLAVEAGLLWAIIAYLGSSAGLALTLAGVTGIIVSIGVSLDSNVVFYEHLKEDIRNGRTPRSAADRSFASAWSTIVKADVASLIAAGLLYYLAVGPVRGFAFYLGLATLLDLFAAWFFMRPAVNALLRTDACQRHPKRFGLPEGPSGPTDGVRRRPPAVVPGDTDDSAPEVV